MFLFKIGVAAAFSEKLVITPFPENLSLLSFEFEVPHSESHHLRLLYEQNSDLEFFDLDLGMGRWNE